MFSVMRNDQTQKEVENNLQSFEFENLPIRCTDAIELQAPIPCVKRLLQLFPQIKEMTNRALSSYDIRNNVYQIGTKHYLRKFQQSPLDFKLNALFWGNFLSTDQQKILQLWMIDGDAWTGQIKFYLVLEKSDRLIEGH